MDSEFSFQDAHSLLRRDWFLDMEDLDEFLWCLTDDVFHYVLQSKNAYSPRIRYLLYMYEPKTRNVRDITEEEMNERFKGEELERIQSRKDSLKNYIAPPRPKSFWDTELEELNSNIQSKKDQLKKYSARPRMYATQISQMETEIRLLQNGFETLKQKVDAKDRNWHEIQWIKNVSSVSGRHMSL